MKTKPISIRLADFALQNGVIPAAQGNITLDTENYECIYCGDKLFLNSKTVLYHELPIFGCGKCNLLSDLGSDYDYDILPATYSQTEYGTPPYLTVRYNPMVDLHSAKDRISKLSTELFDEFYGNIMTGPMMLNHFTNPASAISIISGSKFWAFNAADQADKTEIRHAQDLIKQVFEETANDLNDDCKEFMKRGIEIICSEEHLDKYYIICFTKYASSEKHWGDYAGKGTGVALGISTPYLGVSDSILLRKVIYNYEEKCSLIRNIFIKLSNLYNELEAENRDLEKGIINTGIFAGLVDIHLSDFLFTFKDEFYSNENEYRLVIDTAHGGKFDVHNFRDKRYIEIKMTQTNPAMTILPIIAVYFGTNTLLEDKKAIVKSLREHNYGHVEIAMIDEFINK